MEVWPLDDVEADRHRDTGVCRAIRKGVTKEAPMYAILFTAVTVLCKYGRILSPGQPYQGFLRNFF